MEEQPAFHPSTLGIDSSVTNDFVSQGIRHSLHHLGEITGKITTDEISSGMYVHSVLENKYICYLPKREKSIHLKKI